MYANVCPMQGRSARVRVSYYPEPQVLYTYCGGLPSTLHSVVHHLRPSCILASKTVMCFSVRPSEQLSCHHCHTHADNVCMHMCSYRACLS